MEVIQYYVTVYNQSITIVDITHN